MRKKIELFDCYFNEDSIEFNANGRELLVTIKTISEDGECFECNVILNPYDIYELIQFMNSLCDYSEL